MDRFSTCMRGARGRGLSNRIGGSGDRPWPTRVPTPRRASGGSPSSPRSAASWSAWLPAACASHRRRPRPRCCCLPPAENGSSSDVAIARWPPNEDLFQCVALPPQDNAECYFLCFHVHTYTGTVHRCLVKLPGSHLFQYVFFSAQLGCCFFFRCLFFCLTYGCHRHVFHSPLHF